MVILTPAGTRRTVSFRKQQPLGVWMQNTAHTHAHARQYLPLTSVSLSASLWNPHSVFWLGEAAHYAPREANCPVALFRFPSHSLCPLPSPQLWSLNTSFGESSGVHAEPQALDPSEVPQGRKVTPGWTPIETAYTPRWEAGRGEGRVTLTERWIEWQPTEEKQD